MKSIKQLKKDKKIIAIIVAVIIVILITSGIVIYNTTKVQKDNFTLENQEILLLSEKDESASNENEVLNVELDEPNQNQAEQPNVEHQNEQNEQKPEQAPKVETPYYIKVNNQANVVTVYKKGRSGEYTEPIKAMVCSVGRDTPTSGVYSMSDKYTWRRLWTIRM